MRNFKLMTSLVISALLGAAPSIAAAQDVKPNSGVSIPADADSAMRTLVESPRHGEWVDIDLPDDDADLRTWVVYPERADKAPVVIVIHEIFGLTDWVRAVADQLAADGFIAIAPDLLSGKGPDGGGTESFDGDAVRSAIRGLDDDEVIQRLNAVRTYGTGLAAATDRFAVIGYCWGGSTSFLYATAQPDLDAAVVYYGTAPTDRDVLGRIEAPVLGLYGGDDARVTSTVAATAEAMRGHDKSFTHHIYAGAGHGFLRQQSGRDGANMRASQHAWRETVTFLRQYLEPKSPHEGEHPSP